MDGGCEAEVPAAAEATALGASEIGLSVEISGTAGDLERNRAIRSALTVGSSGTIFSSI